MRPINLVIHWVNAEKAFRATSVTAERFDVMIDFFTTCTVNAHHETTRRTSEGHLKTFLWNAEIDSSAVRASDLH
jgi:hypothetical protein